MSWKELVLKELKIVLQTPPDSEERLEACQELLHTVEEQLDLAKVEGARALAAKIRTKVVTAVQEAA
jgi:hypothetical protein